MAEMDGFKKAAILMISLGTETSSQVMKHLPADVIQKVSYEIANTDVVSPEEKDQVLNDFVNTAQARQYVLDGGIDYAKNVLKQALGPQKAKEVIDLLTQIQYRERPFNIARKADEQQLVNLLLDEHPQTIALVLCYIQPDKAARVLSEFPKELQVDVAERIGTISSTSPKIIHRIEKVMESKFSTLIENDSEKVGGVKALVDILNSASRSTEKSILGDLEKTQPTLAGEVKASLFTFEDIVTLDKMDVQKVLRDVANDVLALALKGSNDDIKNFIYENLSNRAVDNLKEELEFMGPTRLSAVEEAQQEIVGVIRKLDEAGEIYIGRGEEDAVV
ncbi:flagellar motor switch protein FliG [Ligilactobacillus agilis DSM 20509]|uniref:Flagellar motor switch protein FliG n=2 Tax=Ligilactobacillus agilis TaxID=1601 RepID=A0A0R2A8A0_9LACO|nr:flagellar motor switch protein FliG [Ligilactobacillus agilis]AJA33721.1 flagellar motor switch protein FliG [Ligilactobacillus agilis]KRM62933.1 flagellar motor switch protein FliG [Ligilactobacillus agilis DSM 20509]MBL1055376.1 flagellar motor switch protein FliG [Ligilactobacillus agilis]MDK6809392.1 flagellar motor switch protein FliG [Ligilactobacillus agilis]UNL43415.1 flagellar motor switch protein FliG [Ligilactobacillus agilis]